MSDVRQLYNLQQLDTQLDQARARLTEIDRILNDNTALQEAKDQANLATEKRTKAQLALKRAEQDVEVQQEKIDKNQKKLYGGRVKAPKELEDLQMEAGALRRYLVVLEDKQLEAMIAYEEAEASEKDSQTNLETTLQEVADQNQDLSKEQEALTKEVEQLEYERQGVYATIPQDILSQYEKLRQDRRGLAVTEVKDNTCAACGATLTAAQAQVARSPSQITNCNMCGRILHG
jgi:predicted  nucleic acid-binding Zn-ribbon protein